MLVVAADPHIKMIQPIGEPQFMVMVALVVEDEALCLSPLVAPYQEI